MKSTAEIPSCLRAMPAAVFLCLFLDVSSASVHDTIERCSAATTKDQHIACLENALLAMSGDTDEQVQVLVEESPREPEGPAPLETMPVEADPQVAAESVTPPMPDVSEVTDANESAEPAGAAPAKDAQVTPEPVSRADELGAEQVAVRRGDKEEVQRIAAVVIRHAEVGYQKLRVTLDNGQVWQQTDGDRIRVIRKLRDDPTFAVELWQTRSGGYRMHIPSKEITLRVKRLQ